MSEKKCVLCGGRIVYLNDFGWLHSDPHETPDHQAAPASETPPLQPPGPPSAPRICKKCGGTLYDPVFGGSCECPHPQAASDAQIPAMPEDGLVGTLPPADYRRLSDYWMERTGLAEAEVYALREQLEQAKAGWDSAIADLKTAADICRESEQVAERKGWNEAIEAAAKECDDYKAQGSCGRRVNCVTPS